MSIVNDCINKTHFNEQDSFNTDGTEQTTCLLLTLIDLKVIYIHWCIFFICNNIILEKTRVFKQKIYEDNRYVNKLTIRFEIKHGNKQSISRMLCTLFL